MTTTAPPVHEVERHDAPGRRSWGLTVAAITIIAVVIGFMGRDLWFMNDDWDFLTQRRVGSLDDYLRPHAGHWTATTVPVYRVLHALVGTDYFPWYFLPRLIVAGLLALAAWRFLIARGAAPQVASAAVVVLMALRATGGHRGIAAYVCMAAVLGVGVLVTWHDPPSRRDQLALALVLLLAVTSFGTGVLLVAATAVALAVSGRLLPWLPGLAVPVAAYAWWHLRHGSRSGPRSQLNELASVPGTIGRVLLHGLGDLVGLGPAAGAVLAIAVAAVLVTWWRQGRLDLFDGITLLTLALFLLSVTWARSGTITAEGAVPARYAYEPVFLLMLVVVPRLRLPRSRVAVSLVLAGTAALLVVNLVGLRDIQNTLEEQARRQRPLVETTAALMASGEPFQRDSYVVIPLTTDGVARLVADGWRPPPDPGVVEAARGVLRVGFGPGSDDDPPPPVATPCKTLAGPGDAVQYVIDGHRPVWISAAKGTRVLLTASDADGQGRRVIEWGSVRGTFKARTGLFPIVSAEGGGRLRVTLEVGDGVTVCAP